jgi:hypothetical protein
VTLLQSRHKAELTDALTSAFTVDELATLVRTRLGRNVEALVSLKGPADQVALELIEAAERQGWVLDLVAQLFYARPGDRRLAELAAGLGVSGFASSEALGRVLRAALPPVDPQSWVSRLDEIAAATCRIEVGEKILGTGFLVGPDLLLTAEHVVADVRNGSVSSGDIGLRFDHREAYDGVLTTSSSVFRLAKDWLVAASDEQARSLDYALLRVDGAPGVQPIGGARAESSARLRHWIDVPDHASMPPGGVVSILGYESGGRLRLSTGALVDRSTDQTRLVYDNASSPGFSGAPCFDANLRLIGLHLGTERRTKTSFGASIEASFTDLDKKGLGYLLHAKLS